MANNDINKTTYQQHLNNHKVMGSRCKECDSQFLPPRPMCPKCYSMDMDWIEMPQTGVLSAFTTVHIAPTAMIEAGYGRDNPYCSGIVELENGQMISALITNIDPKKPDEIKIGSSVEADFVDFGGDEIPMKFLAYRVLS